MGTAVDIPAEHQYSVAPKDLTAHTFEVAVTVAKPDSAGQCFRFPAWIPGSYLIRDMARHVISIRAGSDGEEIALTKTDKHTWQADPCAGPLTLTAELHAFDLNVRGTYLDAERGFFDGACIFPAVVGQEGMECQLMILAPVSATDIPWRVVTSMRSIDAPPYDFGRYMVDNYAELIDHPVAMGDIHVGEFEVDGVPHVLAVNGASRFDMGRMCHDLEALCESQMAFLGKPDDLDRYVFLLNVRENGYGGLEHCWSSSLMCSRGDLPKRGAKKVTNGYRKLLGLCSHEYFHLWNVKRMKPARFTPYELRQESHTGLLWVFEGITSYYDDLFLVRSGLISVESYLELLAKTVTRVLRTRGRLRQTIEESSFDAWTKLYKPNANSSNSMISYYSKGSLVALALDLTIRHQTGGAASLDDVMQACWDKYGRTGEGMPERGLEDIARKVTGLELADFFERYVRGTADLPLAGLLKTVGVELHLRAANGPQDAGGKEASGEEATPPWMGATLTHRNGASQFSLVHADSPAEKAGIAPGDEAIAIDGSRLTAANCHSHLLDYREGDTVTIAVFRDHKVLQIAVTLRAAPNDTCFLSVESKAPVSDETPYAGWLNAF